MFTTGPFAELKPTELAVLEGILRSLGRDAALKVRQSYTRLAQYIIADEADPARRVRREMLHRMRRQRS